MKKGILAEFRAFIARGNVLDMAVGVVIATAFGKITTSLVGDIFLPFIGWLFGGMDLSRFNITLRPAITEGGAVVSEAVVIGLGTFLTAVIDFLLVAFLVFLMVKAFNRARELTEKNKAAEPPPPPPGPTSEELLAQILAELKK